MASRFARSLSFPVSTAARAQFLAAIKSRPSAASYQHRSVSLPARLHPLVSNLEDEIRSLRSWLAGGDCSDAGSPAWISAGLAHIEHLHSSLVDLLQHPQAHDPLRRRSPWAHRLLDDFLRFADVHGRFRLSILSLKDHHSNARAAVRRRDEPCLAAASRSQRKTEKELLKLAAAARSIGRSAPPPPISAADAAEAEIAGIAWEAAAVTASASAAVFAGIALLGSAAAAGLLASRSPSCVVGAIMWGSAAFRRRMEKEKREEEGEKWWAAAMKRMETTEGCIADVENWSHRIFRRMLNTRVFLLNALSPTL